MPTKEVVVLTDDFKDLRLRSINENDIEDLRNWKNTNRASFFLKEEITGEQQKLWFERFSSRDDDHMFVVEQHNNERWHNIGCMGFRLLKDEKCVDGYNIIRGRKIEGATFSMTDAFQLMLAYAASLYPGYPIQVKVIADNPAVEWYERNAFTIIDRKSDYVLMELDKKNLEKINWKKSIIK